MKRWLSNQFLRAGYALQEPWKFDGEERCWRIDATIDDASVDVGDAAGELIEAMMGSVGSGRSDSRSINAYFTTHGLSNLRIEQDKD